LSGEIEADESFIGGKARNMHKAERARKITGRGPEGKVNCVCRPRTQGTYPRYLISGFSQAELGGGADSLNV